MPELPDITVYLDALDERLVGKTLRRVRLGSPFVLRTAEPPLTAAEGRTVVALRRLGKRIALGLDGDLWLVIHLMVAGRLAWRKAGASVKARQTLAAFDVDEGTLVLTEAGTKKRASLHVVAGSDALHAMDPGGLDVFSIDADTFAKRLTRSNHTLKRALTDPRIFSGIGNAYSDEILHRARLSPVTLTSRLDESQITALYNACRDVLALWTERLRDARGSAFPAKVTAFRDDMAVHGRYGQPCPDCGSPVQRIRYATNETNYCARCQTGGRLLADRALSRLLKNDWPKHLDEL